MFHLRAVLLILPLLAVLLPARGLAETCTATDTRLCLQGGRFQVEVAWTVPAFGDGPGHAVPLTDDTGLFWFFDDSNLELAIKVLDGRGHNGHFWIYYGALSDVAYTVTVTDLQTGEKEVYENPPGSLVSRSDTSAFAPEPPGPAPAPATSLAPAPLLRRGSEFPVNVTTQGIQSNSSVAIGADGGFLVVWWSAGVIHGRLYDAAGKPRSGEIPVSEGAFAYAPRVATSASGESMVVWLQHGADFSADLFARVYGPDGQPLGAPFRIGDDSRGTQGSPVLVADAAGGFLVAWLDPQSTRAQRFGPGGNPVGQEAAFAQIGHAFGLAASPAGGFVLTWPQNASGFETDLFARLLDEQGVPTGVPFQVNLNGNARQRGRQSYMTPVFHADGGFSILWTNYNFLGHIPPNTSGLYARRFNASGSPIGGIVTLRTGPALTEAAPVASTLPSGETLVVWHQEAEDVLGQLFDASSWTPRSAAWRINTYTVDIQTEPALAVRGGDVVVTWSSGVGESSILPVPGYGEGTQDGSFFGVFGQRFTLASCALDATQLCLGGRFRVEVRFTDPRTGEAGAARAIPLTSDTGAFWFFGDNNVELILKVLDGRGHNGHFWIYYGALSDVAYTVTVTDTLTDQSRTYRNPRGRLASRSDVDAFPVP